MGPGREIGQSVGRLGHTSMVHISCHLARSHSLNYPQSLELKRQLPMASKATLTPTPANQINDRKFPWLAK